MMAGKYGNKKTIIRGLEFASKREAARYVELLAMQRAGEIYGLDCQSSFELIPAQVAPSGRKERRVTYVADFAYYRASDGQRVVEDVKSPVTAKLPAYIIKRKLMLRVHGIEVVEIF